MKEYAAAQGFKVAQKYVDVETAKATGRIAFGEMVEYLKTHPSIRALLVEKTDRLYRHLKEWVTVDELNVEMHFPKEGVVLSRAMFVDKLDGIVEAACYDKTSGQWREEQGRCQSEIDRLQTANQSYMDEGVQILELASNAQKLCESQEPHQKRRPLNFLLSNCSGDDAQRAGALAVEREGLGEGTRQQHRMHGLGEKARRVGVGVMLGDALRQINEAMPLPTIALGSIRPAAYLEAYIEQGPRLESAGARISAVTGI